MAGSLSLETSTQKASQPFQQQEEVEKAKNPARRGGVKRKRTEKNDDVKNKKSRVTKLTQEEETEYFEDDKRDLEDLWKAAFPVGTEFEQLDALYEFNWDFKHLEEALEEGGFLYGKKVYAFGFAEPQFVLHKDQCYFIHVPTVVVIESTIEPFNKLAIAKEEGTITMKEMRMGWFPYIPLKERDRQVERTNSRIFTLCCNQRRAALRNMKDERVKKFEYCLPYFSQSFSEEDDDLENMKFYKFYPQNPPDFAINMKKSPFIICYYGNTHQLL